MSGQFADTLPSIFRTIPPSILLAVMLLNGCATRSTLQEAKRTTYTNKEGETVVEKPPRPGAYVALPFAAAWDVISLPFAGMLYLLWTACGYDC